MQFSNKTKFADFSSPIEELTSPNKRLGLFVIYVFLTLFFSILSLGMVFSQIAGKIDTTGTKEMRLDLRSSLSDAVSPDDAIGQIEYIPLEQTKNSIFGRIDQLEITSGFYIILDESSAIKNNQVYSSILIFDKKGKFQSRVDRKGISNFIYDTKDKEISFWDRDIRCLVFFDLQGKELRKVPMLFSFRSAAFLPNGLIAYYRGYNSNNYSNPSLGGINTTVNPLVFCKKPFETLRAFFSIDTAGLGKIASITGRGVNFDRSGSDMYFHHPIDYKFYQVVDNILVERYRFIFPADQAMPGNFYTSSKYKDNRQNYLKSSRSQIFDIGSFYVANNNLGFTIYSNSLFGSSFLLNTKNGIVTSISAIKADFLKIFAVLDQRLVGSDGEMMYTWQRASSLIKKNFNGKPISYEKASPELQEFIKLDNPRGNPVLIRFKPI